MKKSIKYAGIAAATLLTVAPIAAPVVSNVTTTQAAVGDTPASQLENAKSNFKDQFGDLNVKEDGSYDALTLGKSAAVKADAFNDANADVIKSAVTGADATLLASKDVNVYMVATDATGYTYDGTVNHTSKDLATAISKSDDNLPVKFDVYAQNDRDVNSNGDAYSKIASFNLKKADDGTELKSINAKFTTPVTVAKNSKTAQVQLVNSTNVTLNDQDGKSVSTTGTSVGQGFFYTYKAAMQAAEATPATVDKGDVSESDIQSDPNSDLEFKTAGTYYQVVTYNAGADTDLDNFIKAYTSDPTSYTVYVNGKVASSGYDFAAKAAAESTEGANDATPSTISFVRAIKVSDDTSTWTVEDVDGQVTTKNDASYYTLKNNDNATITNRALQANTAWKTDKVRTDQNGNKQYRVATGEWVNADDVTFTKAGDVDTSTGALTDIQKVTGTASLDGGNYVYFLYGKDGKVLTQRSLMPGTDWKVINTAKDAEGNTYYRVATNEWLQQGTGVHFN